MTAPDGTQAYERIRVALDAKEKERDALAPAETVDQLPKAEQDEWDVLNEEASNLRAAEDSVRSNTHLE
jgi:hypothetical protein